MADRRRLFKAYKTISKQTSTLKETSTAPLLRDSHLLQCNFFACAFLQYLDFRKENCIKRGLKLDLKSDPQK